MNDRIQALNHHCRGLEYEIFQDDILMANAQVGSQYYRIDLSHCTPTFILKANEVCIALIIQGNRKIDFKKVEKYLGIKKAAMASGEEILKLIGSPIGSVSLINPELRTLIDIRVKELPYCHGGCGAEKYTLKIRTVDLIHVTNAELGDFTKEKHNQLPKAVTI